MPIIKKHDFVEIEYTGRIKEDNSIFDTSEKSVVCVGENFVLKELEEQMIGKEIGKEYRFGINSDKAFGQKDTKLIQLIPMGKFRQQKIQPFPGLQLNIDGVFGVVKTVSGGRCLVDFNHPLAGKDLLYDVKIKRLVEDDKEKLDSQLLAHFHIKDAEIELKDGSASIRLKNAVPKHAQEEFKKIAGTLITGIKNIDFTIAEGKNK